MKRTAAQYKAVIRFLSRSRVVLFFLMTGTFVSAQKISPAPQDLYREANEYMLAGDYQEALYLLLNLDARGFHGSNVSYRIGSCYLNGKGLKVRSIPYLKNAVEDIRGDISDSLLSVPGAPRKAMLYLGIAYRINNDFDKAIDCFTRYKNLLDKNDSSGSALAAFHIERCENARELMAAPSRFTVDTLPANINAGHLQFNPVVTADGRQLYYMEQLKFYDAVMFSMMPDSAWNGPENLTPSVRSDGDHLLTGVSADGNYLLLCLNDVYANGEIYGISRNGDEWGKLELLNSNINTRFNESHASLSPDGRTLYFTSDRPGGFGGLDIYKSEKDDRGTWGRAVNLGPLINTPLNEETPFVTPDGKTLFFSSQGHYNMGGYDIFMSSLSGDEWSAPVNIGYPLNTTDDDLFYYPVSLDRAFQARFPANGMNSELVRLKISSFGNPARYTLKGVMAVKGGDATAVKMSLTSSASGETLVARQLNGDGTFVEKIAAGSYGLQFKAGDKILLQRDVDIPVNFPKQTMIIKADLMLSPDQPAMDSVMLGDILFAFNKSHAETNASAQVQQVAALMKKYPGLKLAVHGYTDALGERSYNENLSKARANDIADLLKEEGIDAARITIIGHGEKDPVALNTTASGKDCPEGRAYNRRVELILTDIPENVFVTRQSSIPLNLRVKK
jgi:outer membrane protein OmpA-like peptidoglycan-associated protein/tetratricopeptide (TPR) repeat protein